MPSISMSKPAAAATIIVLLPLAAFAVFGFLATFEYTFAEAWGWRIAYVALVLASLAGIARSSMALFRKSPSP